jgi:tetratricopeptide (TPR) repeat protein
VAWHYNDARYLNISKAIEFNKHAFALAQRADDIDLQLQSLDTEHIIAHTCCDPYWALKVVHKARDIAGLISMGPREHVWLAYEARACKTSGNLPRALDLCMQAEELLISVGMMDSDRYLAALDICGNVHSLKSEYLEARQQYAQMAEKTSQTCSPGYHAHALCSIAEMDILMEGEVADIVANLNAAESVYVAFGSRRILLCSVVTAELKLYCGDTEDARAAFLECLSKCRSIYPDLVAGCLAALADPAYRMHGTMDSFRWAVVYLAFVQKTKHPIATLHALRCLADVHMSLEDDETALHLFHAALEGGTKIDIHRLRAECMVGIGEIMLRRGDPIEAKEMWAAAHPLFVRSSRMKDATSVKKRLEQLSHTRQDHSHSLLATGVGAVESTAVVFESSDNDIATMQLSLEKLESVSASTTAPSQQLKTVVDPGTSDRDTKLSVL